MYFGAWIIGAKGLITAGVCLQSAQWLFSFTPRFIGISYLRSGLGTITGIILPVVSTLLFMLFLNRVAQFIERKDLASRAKRVLIMQGLGVPAGIGVFFFADGGFSGRLFSEPELMFCLPLVLDCMQLLCL